MSGYPEYSKLETIDNGSRSAWGCSAPTTIDLGTVNILSPDAVTSAAREIRTGERAISPCLLIS